jgi:hypothetical protein
MKKNLILIAFSILLATFSCNKSGDVTPNTKEEVLITAKGTLIGSPITKIIGNSGGNIALPSAGANIIVPAGAMLAGASLTIQATSDMLDSDGQGIQISGDWQKPIWLEFSYPADEANPQSNMIAFQTAKGDWITSQSVKVDKVRKTYAIRLGQTSTTNAKLSGARPSAGSYSFAASHEFFIKPDKAVIDLGESITFTAFAKEGDTDGYWRKGKNGNYYYDDGELVPLTKPKTQPASNNNPDDDDYLVPLVPVSKIVLPTDDDYLEPLPKVIKEAAFTNKKAGYTRSWILMDGPGNLATTGNIGAKYTAPKDASAKGKIAKVSFFSKNDKTRQDLEASATIRIKDGLTRYEGTISILAKTNSINGRKSACSPDALLAEQKMSASFVLTSIKGYENVAYSSYVQISKDQRDDYMTTTVDYSNGYDSDGTIIFRMIGSCGQVGADAGRIILYMDQSKKTYELIGTLSTQKQQCEVESYSFCTEKWVKSKTSFIMDLPNTTSNGKTLKVVGTYNDINNLNGSIKINDTEITWKMKKVE